MQIKGYSLYSYHSVQGTQADVTGKIKEAMTGKTGEEEKDWSLTLEHPGMNAPGTAKMTPFLPLKRSCVHTTWSGVWS